MKRSQIPAKAQGIEQILDILLQMLNILQVIFNLFGIDLSGLFSEPN